MNEMLSLSFSLSSPTPGDQTQDLIMLGKIPTPAAGPQP
jgi:hypothetical protein